MIDFKEECLAFEQEIEHLQAQIDVLEQQLKAWPSSAGIRSALNRVKSFDDVPGRKSTNRTSTPKASEALKTHKTAKASKTPKALPVVLKKQRKRRRSPEEMQQWRGQLKNICQLLGRRKPTFSTNSVIGAMSAQDLEADRQAIRTALSEFAREGMLTLVEKNVWSLTVIEPKENIWARKK